MKRIQKHNVYKQAEVRFMQAASCLRLNVYPLHQHFRKHTTAEKNVSPVDIYYLGTHSPLVPTSPDNIYSVHFSNSLIHLEPLPKVSVSSLPKLVLVRQYTTLSRDAKSTT